MAPFAPSIQVNCVQGLDASSLASSITPRTHFLPADRLARSNADARQRDHFRTVLEEMVAPVSLLLGCRDRQFLGIVRASRWKAAQSSGVARLMGDRPLMALKALMASRQSSRDFP